LHRESVPQSRSMMEPSALGSAEAHISFQASLELLLSQTASSQYVICATQKDLI
jgi:hypothetical protein